MRRLPILPERPHLAPLKPLDSARTTQQRLPNGQLVLTIEHATLQGLAPPMLRWWFENIGGTTNDPPRFLFDRAAVSVNAVDGKCPGVARAAARSCV
jgi:hypothetical protein